VKPNLLLMIGWWAAVEAASAAVVVVTGAAPMAEGLDGVVNDFRAQVSGGGSNNGVGGGPLANGRREVAWDAASLDPFQTPAVFPGDFFNTVSLRGLELAAPGSLRVSGRAASGSTDVLFSTINPAAAAALQAFSPERLLAVYGETTVEARFFLPSESSQRAYVRGFGAVFADVSIFGSTRLDAFGRDGRRLAAVTVPAAPGGLSFAGVWIEGGEWIDHVILTIGEAGIGDGSGLWDVVALDDFIYAEPQRVPEPGVAVLAATAALAWMVRRRAAGG
jgi:hypothetical protein